MGRQSQKVKQKGLAFVLVLAFVLILTLAATAFIALSGTEIRMVRRQNDSTRAFYIAEGGLERAIYDLRQDFITDTTDPNWADGDINGIDVTQGGTVTVPQNRDDTKTIDDPAQPFYSLPYSSTSLDGGSYSVWLLDISGKTDEIWVKSTGTYGDSTRTVVVFVKIDNISPWNTAIFGGAGTGGVLINGNVDIRGSVHILGMGLTPTDYAINMSGSANIGNNYNGIPSTLSSRIPACPTTIFGGETVESLEAVLRVKQGLAGLSGSATAGQTDVSGNDYKETLDGVYVTDGYGGNKGASNVYSDNGTANAYDLGDTVTFPSLSDPYQDYDTYQEYLKDNALVISEPDQLDELDDITPISNFTYTDGTNTISMDGNGNLTIDGIVYLDNDGTLGMGKYGSDKTITYSGSGIIVAEGDVEIDINLLTANTFPTSDVLGIMTPGEIEFDEANIDVMGAFYAETKIEVKKQTNVAGTLVSNYVDMGSQVPSVYQVPALYDSLPTGMINLSNIWTITTRDWQEI